MSMGVMGVLAVLVTVLGAVLFALVFLFVVRGDKLPRDQKNPHRIKYGDLEIGTDRVVMLALVFALMMVLPLGGYLWLSSKNDACAADLAAIKNKHIRIFATIDSHDRDAWRGAKAVLIRKSADKDFECGTQPVVNGELQFATTLNAIDDFFVVQVNGATAPLGRATVTPMSTEQRIVISLEEPDVSGEPP